MIQKIVENVVEILPREFLSCLMVKFIRLWIVHVSLTVVYIRKRAGQCIQLRVPCRSPTVTANDLIKLRVQIGESFIPEHGGRRHPRRHRHP